MVFSNFLANVEHSSFATETATYFGIREGMVKTCSPNTLCCRILYTMAIVITQNLILFQFIVMYCMVYLYIFHVLLHTCYYHMHIKVHVFQLITEFILLSSYKNEEMGNVCTVNK